MPLRIGLFGSRDGKPSTDGKTATSLILDMLGEVALEAIAFDSAVQQILDASMVGFKCEGVGLVGVGDHGAIPTLAGGTLTVASILASPIMRNPPFLAESAYISQKVALFSNLIAGGWLAPPAWPASLGQVALVPIRLGDSEGAVLILARNVPFDPANMAEAEAFARIAGAILDRLRLRQRCNSLAAQTVEMEQAKTEFLARVTHELRTPLASIKASAGLLIEMTERGGPSTQLKLVQNVSRNVDRLTSLVDDLLDTARLHAAVLRFDPQPLDLRPLLGQAVSVIAPIARARRQSIEIDAFSSALMARVDRQRFEQILINLLTNATNFSPAGSKIVLRAYRAEQQVVIEVIDSGVGIPEREYALVFEPFYRGSSADNVKVNGTGLGLAIVKSLVELHGGTISVSSNVGVGSTFKIVLPADMTA